MSWRNHAIFIPLCRAFLEYRHSENTVCRSMILYHCIRLTKVWGRFDLGPLLALPPPVGCQFRSPLSVYKKHYINKKDVSFSSCNKKPERSRWEKNATWSTMSDIFHFFLSLYPSLWLVSLFLLSQGHKMTSPPLAWPLHSRPKEREERDNESGVGPVINSQYTLHASHWPEMHYMTTPSCEGAWVVPP